MSYKYYAEDMAEANAVIAFLESVDDYSGSVANHNLLVSWNNHEISGEDWQQITELAEEQREEEE